MTDISECKAGRKADREAIFVAFKAVIDKHGASYERRDEPANVGFCGPGMTISGKLNGAGFLFDIDDLHERHGDVGGMISWFNADYPSRDFASAMFSAVGDSLKACGVTTNRRKASSTGNWGKLVCYLDAGLALAAARQAFRD